MYTPSQMLNAIRYPGRAGVEINRYFHSRVKTNEGARSIFDGEWDNLIVLDACRYDAFAAHSSLPGTLERRRSLGSTTAEFIRENFEGRTLHDTVYVSANVWYLKLFEELDSELHKFVNLQEKHHDEALGTVPPEAVTEEAHNAAEEYPNKRLIVHYLQPHQPYIGPIGRKLFEVSPGLRETLHQSNVTDDTLRRAYQENLDLVLDSVANLLSSLDGRTVVTADHGEMLGERGRPIPVRTYGHFGSLYHDELVTVPWLVIENDQRKEIVAESPSDAEFDADFDQVEQRLEELGYKL
ncbi:hypothetical protein [Natrialba sp. PRR66]|uniref:hypothetical protein n=1 Tax=Natrialba sp. PRR66 TaxID=3098146 RepID=UPI002B1DEF6F|nr:hypothetical protein [Natrialba sp. PRR66]